MSVVWAFFIFVQIWWIVWFAVLPFGVRAVESPEPMHSTGAPEKPYIAQKIIATSLIATVITGLIMYGLQNGAWHWLVERLGGSI